MDSIERMRRLNELTKELKQHGFAESSFEAIQQANQIYGDDDLSTEVKDGMIRNSTNERVAKDGSIDDNALVNIEKKMAKLAENIDTLTDKLNEIIKAINDMDQRITSLKNRPERQPERVEVKQEEAKHEPVAAQPADDANPAKDDYTTNQRVGNFQSKDVAIDKMFYFGKK